MHAPRRVPRVSDEVAGTGPVPHDRSMRARRLAVACLAGLALTPVWAHRDLDDQIRDVTRRIEAAPRDAALLLQRGELHRAHAAWASAERDYEAARALDPSMEAVDLCLGTMLLESGARLPEALAALDRFLIRQPRHAKGLVTRARVRARLGDLAAAVRDYDAAIAAFESPARPQPEHYLERADALAALQPPRLDEALRGLDEGLARLGDPITLQMRAIDLEVQRGKHDAALIRVDRILALPGRRERWLQRRAAIQLLAGRPYEARRSYEEALAALDTLPAARRSAPSTRKLEAELRSALADLGTPPGGTSP
jgi:predicted Zn-dependent protease